MSDGILHELKRSLSFHFTANVSKLFNVIIYREYNLVWKQGWSVRNDEKVSIRLFSFLMKVTVFTHDAESSKMYLTLMSLDGVHFPGSGRDLYRIE